MFKRYLLIVISISVLLVPFSLCNDAKAQLVFLAGVEDDFAAPADVASPSDILRTVIEYRWEIQDFDLTNGINGGYSNKWIAHTFFDLPPGIVGATLELKIQAGNDPAGAPSDDFWLLFYDETTEEFDTDKAPYRVAIGNRGGTTTGLSGIEWEPGSMATINLDLSALPHPNGTTINVLEDLGNYGFLDVLVTDDTAVDYYKLTIYPTTADDVLNTFEDSVENGDLYGSSEGWFGELQIWIMRILLDFSSESIDDGFTDRACFLLERAYMRSDGAATPFRDFVEGPAKGDFAEMILDLMANQACQ